MKKLTYAIASPRLSQSRTICKLLRRNGYEYRELLLPGEDIRRFRKIDYLAWEELDTSVVVIPSGFTSTRFILELRGQVKLGEIVMRQDSLKFNDKIWSLDFVETLGIRVPETFLDHKNLPSGFFVKSLFEGYDGPKGKFEKVSEYLINDDNLMYQEIVRGKSTIGVAFVAESGQMLTHYTHLEVDSYPKDGGSAIIAEEFEDLEAVESVKTILKASNFSGWGLVEFKRDTENGALYFMELNPKFWASCELAFHRNPLFAKFLFGINMNASDFRSVFFLKRGLKSGATYLLRNRSRLLSSKISLK